MFKKKKIDNNVLGLCKKDLRFTSMLNIFWRKNLLKKQQSDRQQRVELFFFLQADIKPKTVDFSNTRSSQDDKAMIGRENTLKIESLRFIAL